ncbi:MAG TPA: hypothetical protein VEC16_01735 [Alphaproteobacteria bacterium]|nr:hypothetical protein [Alphaproteobacteria bacterium]
MMADDLTFGLFGFNLKKLRPEEFRVMRRYGNTFLIRDLSHEEGVFLEGLEPFYLAQKVDSEDFRSKCIKMYEYDDQSNILHMSISQKNLDSLVDIIQTVRKLEEGITLRLPVPGNYLFPFHNVKKIVASDQLYEGKPLVLYYTLQEATEPSLERKLAFMGGSQTN